MYWLSLALLVISFSFNSLVFFHFFFFSLWFVPKIYWGFKRKDISLFLQGLPLLIIPLFFSLLRKVVWKPFGLYQNYNKIQFNVANIERAYTSFFNVTVDFLWMPLPLPFDRLVGNLIFFFLSGFLILFILRFRGLSIKPNFSAFKLLGWGILGWCLVVLPYALVNKLPGRDFWTTRHMLLLAYPTALMVVSFSQLLAIKIAKMKSNALTFLVFLFVFFNFFYINMKSYGKLYDRMEIERNMINQIEESPHPSGSQAILWSLPAEIRSFNYRFYELNFLTLQAWGKQTTFSLVSSPKLFDPEQTKKTYSALMEKPIYLRKYLMKNFEGSFQCPLEMTFIFDSERPRPAVTFPHRMIHFLSRHDVRFPLLSLTFSPPPPPCPQEPRGS
ncbi:MAG: hypothetical protein AAF203_07935 [Pseudomonadota bacterium]